MKQLGQLLIEEQIISSKDLENGLALQSQTKGRIGQILIKQGVCSEDDVLKMVAKQWQLPRLCDWVDDTPLPVSLNDIDLMGLNATWWHNQNAFPLGLKNGNLWLVMEDIFNSFVIDSITSKNKVAITPVLATNHELRQLMILLEGGDGSADYDVNSLQDMATDTPIVQFVNDTVQRALDARASDIHFESYRGVFRVRFRVDGVLHEVDRPGISMQAPVISRLKLMAGLDISEKRLPQDGRIRLRISGIGLDIRV
ncbi:MAG: Flp pilus assembly complex ATPase component TadA, partial [Gammaproteobacteria bacterium]|nr:Flp pilus assembly complex ATPase component TadA [Gammaproteobacteria bacterium]